MFRRTSRIGVMLALVVMVVLSQASLVSAARRDNLRWEVGCNGFTNRSGGVIFTRDNTGEGREEFTITAVDGEGNVLFGPLSESIFVDSRLYLERGLFFEYETAPAANPILVSIISNEGNGADLQIVYSVIGNCPGLPAAVSEELNEIVFDLLAFVIDPQPSASVPLNSDPPRPVNPDGIGRLFAGYLIVDTSSANLRSGDGPQYTIVGRVSGGTELIVLGVNERRTWWYVQVGDIRGWINNELIINRGDLTDVPIVPVLGEIALPRLYLYTAAAGACRPRRRAQPLSARSAGTSNTSCWRRRVTACGSRFRPSAAHDGHRLGPAGKRRPAEFRLAADPGHQLALTPTVGGHTCVPPAMRLR
ncbi:SH3 domain-containing protein [bacterium]|nr:SH3 domain-containing protein [bacterium]